MSLQAKVHPYGQGISTAYLVLPWNLLWSYKIAFLFYLFESSLETVQGNVEMYISSGSYVTSYYCYDTQNNNLKNMNLYDDNVQHQYNHEGIFFTNGGLSHILRV